MGRCCSYHCNGRRCTQTGEDTEEAKTVREEAQVIREDVEKEEVTPVIENVPDVVPTIAMVGDAPRLGRTLRRPKL